MTNSNLDDLLGKAFEGIPEGDREKIRAMVQKNPTLFISIGRVIEEKVAKGMAQEDALKTTLIERREEILKSLS